MLVLPVVSKICLKALESANDPIVPRIEKVATHTWVVPSGTNKSCHGSHERVDPFDSPLGNNDCCIVEHWSSNDCYDRIAPLVEWMLEDVMPNISGV